MIRKALQDGRKALSEYESKQVLAAYQIPVTQEILVSKRSDVKKVVRDIGYPLVMKGCSAEIAHKTERGLIHVDLRSEQEALAAFDEIIAKMSGQDGDVLIYKMIKGRRELVMGLTRDDQFGPCVMFGLGGIFTEILLIRPSILLSSPSAIISTVPSGRFFAQPTKERELPMRHAKSRKPTPWTLPWARR